MERRFQRTRDRYSCNPQTGLSASLRFGRENEWRRPGRLKFANLFESGVFKPAFDFIETKGVAFFGVDQHLYGEHERMRGLGASVVHQPFRDGNRAARLERTEGFLQEQATTLFAFAVQDVAQSGDVITAAEVRLQYIALDITKAITHAKLLCDPFGRRNHSCPVHSSHSHLRRSLGERNAPNA